MTCKVVIDGSVYDVYIGRTSIWGNPYTHKKTKTLAKFIVNTKKESLEKYSDYLNKSIDNGSITMDNLRELKNARLKCHCKTLNNPNTPCHGDILAAKVNEIFFNENFMSKWGIK